MATILQQIAHCVQGGKIEWYPCTAARTWYKGEFLYLTTVGRMTECGSSATVTCGMAADDNAADVVDTSHPVYVPTEMTMFEMNSYHSTPTSATTHIGMIGQSYNYFAATATAYCDRSATTVPFFKVNKLSEKDASGDLFGRVIVSLVPEVCQIYHSAT